MVNIATTLHNAMRRAASTVLHDIAKTGVVALKRILDKSGFGRSEYLKNYEVYSHVIGDSVLFEILVDIDAVQAEDELTQKALEEQAKALENVNTTYGVRSGRAYSRVRDARKPAQDARKPAKDARKPARDARTTAKDRLLAHEVALHAPRSARITREGKLSVLLKRSMRETESEVRLPQGDFEGIMKNIMDKLSDVLYQHFIPELQGLINDYVAED